MWFLIWDGRQFHLLSPSPNFSFPSFLFFSFFFWRIQEHAVGDLPTQELLFGGPMSSWFFPVVKNPPANAGDAREASSIPEWGRYLEEEMATHSSILAWKIRGAWWATTHGLAESRHDWAYTHAMSLGFVFYCFFSFFLPYFLSFFPSSLLFNV